MTKETDFDIWWNDTHFHTIGPLGLIRGLLEKLYTGGAALRQIKAIDVLGAYLIIVDINCDFPPIRRKKSHHKMEFFDPSRLDQASKEEILALRNEIDARIESAKKVLLDRLRTGEKELQKLAQSEDPFAPAVLEFALSDLIQHMLSRRGSKLDSWGSFFLLAVTEYMKQELGRPHYGTAYDLLRAYRRLYPYRQLKWSEHAKGKSKAIDRIKKLKRAHPLWADALAPLLLYLDLSRDVRTCRTSVRAYLERKRASEPIFWPVNRYFFTPRGWQFPTDLTNVSLLALPQKRSLKKKGK